MHDVPVARRIEWVTTEQAEHPKLQHLFRAACRKLRAQAKSPRYPTFFPLQPVITWAFGPRPVPPTGAELLDTLLIQLRLTTMMRSADVANVTWALFHTEPKLEWKPELPLYICTSTKGGTRRTFSVAGDTARNLVQYTWQHLAHPAVFLFRHLRDPALCLGSERIAKRCLMVLEMLGVDVNVFKSHSLRGSTATHLATKGVPLPWIQGRGGWSSTATLQQHYDRLHQQQNWQDILTGTSGEPARERHSADCVVAVPSTSSQAIPTKEGRSGEDEKHGTTQAAELTARGVLRYLHAKLSCPACHCPVKWEAAYRCTQCQVLHHVRCLSQSIHLTPSTAIPAHTARSPTCFPCSLTQQDMGPDTFASKGVDMQTHGVFGEDE